MPRQARLDAPHTLHHVMVRGLGRRAIFRDDADWGDFVGRLAALAEAGALTVLAWACLSNHLPLGGGPRPPRAALGAGARRAAPGRLPGGDPGPPGRSTVGATLAGITCHSWVPHFKGAEHDNAENLLVIRSKELAAQYTRNWGAHAAHSEPYEGRGR